MRRLLRQWALYNFFGNLAAMCLFLVLTAVAFPITMFVLMTLSTETRNWDFRDFFWFTLIWSVIFYIIFLIRGGAEGMETPESEGGAVTYRNYRKYVFMYSFFGPMLAHIAFIHFGKMCRFIYIRWDRYEEVVRYALRNPRRIPLDEIGAEEQREFDRYIEPLIRLEILQLLPSEPIGVTVTARFREFCTKMVSDAEGGGRS